MTAGELLAVLRARGVTLAQDGDRLRISAARGSLTPELRAALTAQKAEVLDLLRRAAETQRAALPPIRPVDREGPLRLSFGQQRLWFLQQLEPSSAAYTIASAIRFSAAADPAIIERGLTELVRRHESLRTSFAVVGDEPSAIIAAPSAVSLPLVDLRHLDDTAQAEAEGRLRAEEARHVFDLASAPPIRFVLVRRTGHSSLLVTQHHIITDRWSMGLLMRELAILCDCVRTGQPLPADPALQYVDFAHWQRDAMQTSVYREHLDYWKRQLASPLSILELPPDRPRPPLQTYEGSWETRVLQHELRTELLAFARTQGVTPFMLLLAAFAVLLSRYAGQHDTLIGSPIAGRTESQTEGIIGCFVNTLVMRLRLEGTTTFRQLLNQTRDVALDAYAHQDMPFEHLVAQLHPDRDLSRSPIFQVVFNFQTAPKSAEVTEEMSITTSGSSMFDLSLTLSDAAVGLQATFEYNVALFDRSTVARLLLHYETLLFLASRYPDVPVAFLPMLTPGERVQMDQWNQTAEPYQRTACIHDLVAEQARRTPDHVAVASDSETLTYAELVDAGARVAGALRAHGITRGSRVGVCVERTARMLPALLGVLMADAAYVPLDPAFPHERLAYMIEDAGVRLAITDRASERALPAELVSRVLIDRDSAVWTTPGDLPLRGRCEAEDPAYVIYTSGSTGRPKGVQVPHRAVVNFLTTMAREPGLTSQDVLVAVTTLSFDIAGLELYLPLTVGARLEVASREQAGDGRLLAARLSASSATVLQATPATWRLLLDAGWTAGPELRMWCGGEGLPPELAAQLVAGGRPLWNLYGPTETTIWSTVDRVAADAPVTIGRPIANTQAYVCDAAGQSVPVGVPGELHLGGAGLAHGYLGQPALTAERFVPDPFSGVPGARLYRTGDVARWRADGRLQCLGRVDHQVKVRGFRIELGEIETALASHPAIHAAVVTAQPDATGTARLVAYFVADRDVPTTSDLRRFLKTTLPDYMVPSFFMQLDALPLTQNRKVDRLALPRTFGAREGDATYVAPRTPTEQRIAAVWQEVLGIERVSIDANFFDVGGHSLLAMKVIARIEAALGLRLNPRVLMLDTLEQIAAGCDRRHQAAVGTGPRSVQPLASTA